MFLYNDLQSLHFVTPQANILIVPFVVESPPRGPNSPQRRTDGEGVLFPPHLSLKLFHFSHCNVLDGKFGPGLLLAFRKNLVSCCDERRYLQGSVERRLRMPESRSYCLARATKSC